MRAHSKKRKKTVYKKELVVSFVSMLLIYLVSAGLNVKAQYTEDGKAFILA